MDNEWKPIETAPGVGGGEFLVRGGEIEGELGFIGDAVGAYTVAHVTREVDYYGKEIFEVCNTVAYSAWVNNPTEWKPI